MHTTLERALSPPRMQLHKHRYKLGLISVGSCNAVVGRAQVGACCDKVHVEVGVVVFLKFYRHKLAQGTNIGQRFVNGI